MRCDSHHHPAPVMPANAPVPHRRSSGKDDWHLPHQGGYPSAADHRPPSPHPRLVQDCKSHPRAGEPQAAPFNAQLGL